MLYPMPRDWRSHEDGFPTQAHLCRAPVCFCVEKLVNERIQEIVEQNSAFLSPLSPSPSSFLLFFPFLFPSFLHLLFLRQDPCSPGWPQTYHVAKDDLECESCLPTSQGLGWHSQFQGCLFLPNFLTFFPLLLFFFFTWILSKKPSYPL